MLNPGTRAFKVVSAKSFFLAQPTPRSLEATASTKTEESWDPKVPRVVVFRLSLNSIWLSVNCAPPRWCIYEIGPCVTNGGNVTGFEIDRSDGTPESGTR
jgi:hypothetical protein